MPKQNKDADKQPVPGESSKEKTKAAKGIKVDEKQESKQVKTKKSAGKDMVKNSGSKKETTKKTVASSENMKESKSTKTKPTKQKTGKKESRQVVAQPEYRVSIELKPSSDERNNCIKLFDEAVKCFHSGKQDDAEKKFGEIIAKFPGFIDIVSQAKSYLERIKSTEPIKISKNDYHSHIYIADGYFNRCMYDKAIEYWEKALKIDGEKAEPYYNIAATQSLLGKKSKAVNFLASAIQRDKTCLEYCQVDPDFDNIRDTNEFKKMMEEAETEVTN